MTYHDIDHFWAYCQNVELVFNAQHDCERLGCQPTGRRVLKQERIETDQFITVIEHTEEEHYIVNIHSFHRAHLVRKVFDSSSYAISPVLDPKHYIRNSPQSIVNRRPQQMKRIMKHLQRILRKERRQRKGKGKEKGKEKEKEKEKGKGKEREKRKLSHRDH